MNEDMSEILNKFSSVLKNSTSNEGDTSNSSSGISSISPETISSVAKILSSNNNAEGHDNSTPNIDIDTILKFKTMFEKMNSKDDPRARLLLALKPYLKESRKNKVEQYIQFFNISKIINTFEHRAGGDGNK